MSLILNYRFEKKKNINKSTRFIIIEGVVVFDDFNEDEYIQ
jgi:hypothetical protein